MRKYRIAKGWAIFIYIFAPLLIALFAAILVMPFFQEDVPSIFLYFMIPLSLVMIAIMVIALLDTIYWRLLITSDSISLKSTFINRKLKFEEVEGYKVENNYIFIVPNTTEKKNIKISTYIGKTDELTAWLEQNFNDLHLKSALQEEEQILSNFEYGRNEDERAEKLNQARRTSRILNITGFVVFIWTSFIASPYLYAIVVAIAIPITSVLAVVYFQGLIRINEKKGSAYPSVAFAVIMPTCGLALRALLDYNILEYSKIWIPSLLIASGLVALTLFSTKEIRFRKPHDFFTIIFLLAFFFSYGFSLIVTTNCYFDDSLPTTYQAEILEKRISSGKTTSYYLKLTLWGNQTESDEVSVSKSFYEMMEIGDPVNIYLKQGKYDIPWFLVTK